MFDEILKTWKQVARQIVYLRPYLHWTLLDNNPISLDRAVDIFDQLASREDFDFNHIREGCTIRAHLLAEEIMEMGLRAYKAWAFAEREVQENTNEGKVIKHLYVTLPDGTLVSDEGWAFHVAASLPVKMTDGSVVDFVFDPSLFDGPVPANVWANVMNTPAYGLQITIFGKIPSGENGDYHPQGISTRRILRSKQYHPKIEMNQFKLRNAPSHELFHSPYRGDKPPLGPRVSHPKIS